MGTYKYKLFVTIKPGELCSPTGHLVLILFSCFVKKCLLIIQVKKASEEEAITSDVVGQAHVENYALKVFLYADNEDRAARFNK